MTTPHLSLPNRQQTLAGSFTYVGRGLHTGRKVALQLLPAAAGSGIRFVRRDVRGARAVIPARSESVVDTQLCTVLANPHGVSVRTVEHLLAALRGCDVDNAVIELDGPEVPILDGSAEPFVSLIRSVGTRVQAAPRRGLLITRPVAVAEGDRFAVLLPHPTPWISAEIAFASAAIGSQALSLALDADTFAREIAPARTFGFAHEIDWLRSQGLARGGSVRNAIVVDGHQVVNAEGLRYPDEFVRHKILDCVGDLALAGAPVIGHLRAHKSGHRLNHALLRELFAERNAWTWANLGEDAPPAGAPSGDAAVPCASRETM